MRLDAGTELDRRGWNPLRPSGECMQQTTQPNFSHYLDQLDRIGVHRKLLDVDLILRFWPVFRRSELRTVQVRVSAATLHAIRAEGIDITSMTMPIYQSWLAELLCWEQTVFVPAMNAFEKAQSPEEVRTHRARFEPALTYRVLLFEGGMTDFVGNRKALKAAMRLAEHQGVLTKQHRDVDKDLANVGVTDEDVYRFILMITDQEPDRNLFHASGKGQFILGAEEARDAENKHVYPIQPVYEQSDRRSLSVAADKEDPSNPLAALEAGEALQTVRKVLMERRDRRGLNVEAAVALDHFVGIRQGEESARAVAEKEGISRATLDRRLRELDEEIRERLTA